MPKIEQNATAKDTAGVEDTNASTNTATAETQGTTVLETEAAGKDETTAPVEQTGATENANDQSTDSVDDSANRNSGDSDGSGIVDPLIRQQGDTNVQDGTILDGASSAGDLVGSGAAPTGGENNANDGIVQAQSEPTGSAPVEQSSGVDGQAVKLPGDHTAEAIFPTTAPAPTPVDVEIATSVTTDVASQSSDPLGTGAMAKAVITHFENLEKQPDGASASQVTETGVAASSSDAGSSPLQSEQSDTAASSVVAPVVDPVSTAPSVGDSETVEPAVQLTALEQEQQEVLKLLHAEYQAFEGAVTLPPLVNKFVEQLHSIRTELSGEVAGLDMDVNGPRIIGQLYTQYINALREPGMDGMLLISTLLHFFRKYDKSDFRRGKLFLWQLRLGMTADQVTFYSDLTVFFAHFADYKMRPLTSRKFDLKRLVKYAPNEQIATNLTRYIAVKLSS